MQANADALAAALASLPEELRGTARLVATAHSIPDAMAAVAGPQGHAYEAELMAAAERVVAEVAPGRPFDLVWQSRSGPPSVPWLEPDVNDHLRALAEDGETAVVLFPVGFISDHLEVIWDLDNEAKETAEEARARVRPRGDRRHPPGVRRDRSGGCWRSAAPAGCRAWAPNCPAGCCFVQRASRPAA